MWNDCNDITELPKVMIDRLRHYFTTYKMLSPDDDPSVVIDSLYGRDHAVKVVEAALADYTEHFGD